MARPTDRALANLRRIDAMEPEEKTAFTRKGQAAGAEVRRRKRALRDVLDALLSMEYTGTTDSALAEAAQSAAKARDATLNQYDIVAIAQIIKAQGGDTAAAAWVRDSAGDKPGEAVTVQQLSAEDVELARKVAARLDASGNKSTNSGAVNSANGKKKR